MVQGAGQDADTHSTTMTDTAEFDQQQLNLVLAENERALRQAREQRDRLEKRRREIDERAERARSVLRRAGYLRSRAGA